MSTGKHTADPPESAPRRHPAHSWTTMIDGRRLRQLRRRHGLSQDDLATKAGISLTTVARLERQSSGPCRCRTLARLARALDEDPASTVLRPPPN